MLWNEVWLVCLVSGSVAHQLLMVAGRLTLTHYKHSYSVGYEVVFSVQYVPDRTVPIKCVSSSCFINRATKNKKKLHTCQSHFWCTAASRHNWTPHHIILHKCQERWGQGDPVHLNCRAQNIVLGLFAAGGASQTVPSDLRLKLDQLHTSLPSHTAICPRFFFYLFNSRLPPSPSPLHFLS